MSGWRAIWPVLNDGRRHRVELVGRQRWSVRPGWDVPGSAGAEWVVVCESCVVVRDRREVAA